VSGSYTFFVTSGDGFAFYLDDVKLLGVPGSRVTTKSTVPAQTLSAGVHDMRIEYFEKDNTGGLQLSWKPAGSTVESIMTPSDFFCYDLDGDRLPDVWEQYTFPDTWNTKVHDGTEDTDGDGTSDKDELNLYLTDPLLPLDRPYSADAWAKPDDLSAGVVVSYLTGAYKLLPDFPGLPHYGTAVLPQKPEDPIFSYSYPSVTTPAGCFLTSGKYDNVGAYFKGYLNIPADGAYRFQLECDDLASMVIDGVKVIDCDSLTLHSNPARLHNGFIPLKAGLHPFSISYYENTGIAKLILRYEGPGFTGLQPVPVDWFFYSEKFLAAQKDTDDDDLDELNNKLEEQLGTKSDVANTDGDGFNDGDEYNKRLDPLTKTIFIYVDGSKGLDTRTGLTMALAKKTIAAGIGCWKDDNREYVICVKAQETVKKVKTNIVYSGEGNTNITVSKPYLKIRPWPEDMDTGAQAVVDCMSSGRAFILTNVPASTEIEEFKFINCLSSTDGGAINLSGSSAGIINCSFSNCEASGAGGAIYASGGSSLIDRCMFEDCRASSGGALAAAAGSSMKITRSMVFSCQTWNSGGAVDVQQASLSIENCFIGKNTSVDGAVSADSDNPMAVSVSSCTIADNISSSGPGGVAFSGSGAFTVLNTILHGNGYLQIGGTASPAVTYSDVQYGYPGEGNLDVDPCFLADGRDFYHLSEYSQCIEAGTSAGAPAIDIDGDPRPDSGNYDMGADEYCSQKPGFSITPDQSTIREDGGSCQIKVQLRSRPEYQVAVDCLAGSGDVSLDRTRLTFLPDSWRQPQTVTVYARQNNYVPDTSAQVTFSICLPLSDIGFGGFASQSATIGITSDDTADFIISPASITVPENGGTGPFTAVLNTAPAGNVVLNLSIDKSSEGLIDRQVLTFTPLNWNMPKTVTVTGADDQAYGDNYATVTVSVDSSSDTLFAGIDPKKIPVTFSDDTRDTDGDGMPDDWETEYGFDPFVKDTDINADADGDGLGNIREFQLHTNPRLADTDGDGLGDGEEVDIHLTDPARRDSDGDGIGDGDEIAKGTDPKTKNDTDGDGLPDDWELQYFSSLAQDASGDSEAQPDSLCNMVEYELGTRPDQPTADDGSGSLGLKVSVK
ncbi:MAG: PA14 domain-containing protein, partial [Victivallales bacterium]